MKAYIGLGSNLGDRAGNLLLAVRGLMEAGLHVSRLSAIYETSPVGVSDQSPYLNMVAEIEISTITPSQILARMVRIEYLLGRRHKFLGTPRTADLDLLFYGDTKIDTEFLQVPHRNLHNRRFVLVPLCELSPHFIHPVEKKTVRDMLEQLDDNSMVERWDPNTNVDIDGTSDAPSPQSFSKSSNN
ncbi:MAG: 2-amino-4-hydroxy-6-hydroxymethyldihydropteridine diphosphokinase [Pyrinomonadaceae bacterium]|nr:2-amino-4-hydroxy-6-hydroxymethyldihydropteridine diphosphokinase [Pyrinomonadaceae bacterium]